MGPLGPLAYLRPMAVLTLASTFLCCPGLRAASAATVLATLAALLGVVAPVVIMAAMDGFRTDLSKKMPSATPICRRIPRQPGGCKRPRACPHPGPGCPGDPTPAPPSKIPSSPTIRRASRLRSLPWPERAAESRPCPF